MANLTGTDDRWSWADRGSCQGQPENFFNEEDDAKGLRRDKEKAAKGICQECPVLVPCRRYAMAARERYGVWG